MFEEKYYLPYSNNKYIINNTGNVLDINNNKISTYKIENRIYVNIDWIDGFKPYPVALLVLAAFGKLYALPSCYYNEIELLFIDNIEESLSPGNIIYRFKNGPIEVNIFLGYYYIPLYTSYAINKDGDVINVITGKYLKPYIQRPNIKRNRKGGYRNLSLTLAFGKTTMLSAHRALCYTFKHYDSSVLKLTVNHKDGNPTNNDLDNLEWSTYRDNNIHAIENNLRASRSRAVLVRNLKTGDVKRYFTITQCSRAMGYPHTGLVRHRLDSKFSLNGVYSDFLQFKYDDGTPWPEVDLNNLKITYNNNADIIARNVFTDERVIFTGSQVGKDFTGVEPATISRHLRDGNIIPTNGWNFQYLDCQKPWPNHSHRHLKIYEKYPLHPRNGLIAINSDTNEELFFTSVRDGATELNLNMVAVTNAAQRNRKYKNYFFKYFKLTENLGLPIE